MFVHQINVRPPEAINAAANAAAAMMALPLPPPPPRAANRGEAAVAAAGDRIDFAGLLRGVERNNGESYEPGMFRVRLLGTVYSKALQLCLELRVFLSKVPYLRESVVYIFLHLSSPNMIENDHNFMFFGYKVSTQQHFQSRLF